MSDETLRGLQCDHRYMESDDGVHFFCPTCEVNWDDWGEGGGPPDEEPDLYDWSEYEEGL